MITEWSRWAGDLAAADPGAAAVLADPGTPVDVEGAASTDDLVRRHRREVLRIAARDVDGVDDLRATIAGLSAAEAALWAGALRLVDDDRAGGGAGLAVIGMGKLGAGELNYASDVDVVFVADDPVAAEPAARAAASVVRRCIRVDLDLRPGGRGGSLVRSVDGYVAHWARWADPWERQALLKARPVAGPADLGDAWAAAAGEALWGRPFGPDEIRAVRAMKARSESEVARRRAGELDLKRGVGGIRDVEFAVQLLQLVHGRDDPDLRARATLDALAELAAGGYVAEADAEALAGAYTDLRLAEHRLQLVDLAPAHVLPRDPEALDRLARAMGERATAGRSAGDALVDRLRRQRAVARVVHERLWFRPLLGAFAGRDRALAAFGFADADRTRAAIEELTAGLSRISRLMQQLLPLLLEWLSVAPDPDLGLLGFRHLVAGPGRAAALADAFRDSPEVARRLCLVLGTSAELGQRLVHNPDLVPVLADAAALVPDPAAIGPAASSSITWRGATEERRLALKRFTDREGVRIAASDVLGLLDRPAVGVALTALAEAATGVAFDAVCDGQRLAIVAMGRFGAGELSYPSDLDVVFVGEGDHAALERAAARWLQFLGGATPVVYDVDPDLRPEGRDGPLVRSLDAWRTYVERWAEPWERLAWVKARPVAGDLDLGTDLVEGVLGPWVWDRPITDAERLELRRVKVRVERERVRPGDDRDFHLKLGPGGLTDIEFCVQLLQLERGVRIPATAGAIAALDGDGELGALAECHRFLEVVRDRLFLVTGDDGDALPAQPERLARLATSLGTTPVELRERHRRLTRRARRVVERLFYGRE